PGPDIRDALPGEYFPLIKWKSKASAARRREFIKGLAVWAATWPFTAQAQQCSGRIGILMSYQDSNLEAQARLAAFKLELQQLGWSCGHNAKYFIHWVTGSTEGIRQAAVE